MITLKGHGVVTYWQFPKRVRTCPISSCRRFCTDRLAAMDHFKSQHAEHSILCTICKKPVVCKQKSHYASHYHSLHPGVEQIPFDLSQKREHPIEKAAPTKKVCIYNSIFLISPRLINNFYSIEQ